MDSFLLYGSYGYTGQLIASLAKSNGIAVTLAGRNREALKSQADQLDLPFQVFSLENQGNLEKNIEKFPLVVHAAGPFRETFLPMVQACLKTGTHYTDITGEVGVFEQASRLHEAAQKAGITLLPGIGFDVVPTDCVAVQLHQLLPDANKLRLAFVGTGPAGPSRGTSLTVVSGLGEGGMIRTQGKLEKVPLGHEGFTIDFGIAQRFVMAIPWGDLSTAWHSTGIPNITTYMGIHPKTYQFLKYQKLINWFLRTNLAKNYFKRKIQSRAPGPSEAQREASSTLVWGEVSNDQGEKKNLVIRVPEGYTTTARTAVLLARKILEGKAPTGFQTPATAFGSQVIYEIEGVSILAGPK